MGFGLEHQIKSTSGVGVNGGSESLEACGSNGFHFICPRAPFQQTDRAQPKRTGQLPWRRGFSQGGIKSLLPMVSGKWVFYP